MEMPYGGHGLGCLVLPKGRLPPVVSAREEQSLPEALNLEESYRASTSPQASLQAGKAQQPWRGPGTDCVWGAGSAPPREHQDGRGLQGLEGPVFPRHTLSQSREGSCWLAGPSGAGQVAQPQSVLGTLHTGAMSAARDRDEGGVDVLG